MVEVDDIQTNGVQFWISVTNTPGTTNAAFFSTNGCLYANLVDTNNVSHEIFSAPGLIQSNVFQHVALTYSTNSGIANLYYNGTNVATTNLGRVYPEDRRRRFARQGHEPRDEQLLRRQNGRDEHLQPRACRMPKSRRFTSISASTTNRLVGKFDPSVTPP